MDPEKIAVAVNERVTFERLDFERRHEHPLARDCERIVKPSLERVAKIRIEVPQVLRQTDRSPGVEIDGRR
jgi:hypothetical protein